MMTKKLFGAGALALALMVSSTADAGWHSWGSHGSSGGSWGYWGSHGSWGSRGSHGGLLHRIFHRHHYSRGSWGSHGSWGSYGSWGSSGGSWGSSGGVIYSSPAQPRDAAPPPPASEEVKPMASSQARNVHLTVAVPEGAKVFVNDAETTSTGPMRSFISRDVEPGKVYTYTVRAEVMRDGQMVTESKSIRIPAGYTGHLRFELNGQEQVTARAPRTALILRVPADAKVTLAGKATSATGEIREFSTTRLAADTEWANYPVRVEITREGQTLVEEKLVTLKAGEMKEVTFDFEEKLAALAK